MADDNLLSGLSIDRNEADSSSSHKAVYSLLAVVVLGAAGFTVWMMSGNESEAQVAGNSAQTTASTPAASSQPAVSQSSTPLRTAGDNKILDASGYVVAMRIATASSKTVGRIDEVLVEEGMEVKQGQILARLDSTSQRIQLELSQARLAKARAVQKESESRLQEAQLAYTRAQMMREDKLISQEELDKARIAVDVIQAQLDGQAADIRVAQQEIQLQQQIIEDNIIRAPFDGVVVQKNAQPGEIISPSTSGGGFTRTGICTIVDMSSLEIEVDVNESYINRVMVGRRAEAVLDAYPDWVIPAEVSAIVPTADRQRATIKVRVRFEQLDPKILPDMGVKVSFFDETAQR